MQVIPVKHTYHAMRDPAIDCCCALKDMPMPHRRGACQRMRVPRVDPISPPIMRCPVGRYVTKQVGSPLSHLRQDWAGSSITALCCTGPGHLAPGIRHTMMDTLMRDNEEDWLTRLTAHRSLTAAGNPSRASRRLLCDVPTYCTGLRWQAMRAVQVGLCHP